MYPVKDTTRVFDASQLLLEQYKHTDVIAALVAIHAGQLQILENSIWSILDNMTLAVQPLGGGNQDILDKIGAIVGLPRNGLNDVDYLAAIKVKSRVNRSDGLAEDLIQITSLVFSGGKYREWYPAAWEIDVEGAPVSVVTALLLLLREAKATGTAGNLRYSLSGPIWIWGWKAGFPANGTGLDYAGMFPNAPVMLQTVTG